MRYRSMVVTAFRASVARESCPPAAAEPCKGDDSFIAGVPS